jgi:hypothetical protein
MTDIRKQTWLGEPWQSRKDEWELVSLKYPEIIIASSYATLVPVTLFKV